MNNLHDIDMHDDPLLRVFNLAEFVGLDLPPREIMLTPWLHTQGLAMIYAPRGLGKTHVSLGIAYAVATGTDFLGWEAPKPRGVLYVDGEMPAADLQDRLTTIASKHEMLPENFYLLAHDQQERGIPDLCTPAGRWAIEKYVKEDVELVIFDNLSTLFPSRRENEADSWGSIQQWALSLRARGKTVLFIHHSGKSGAQRGTSRTEDALDTVISLQQPSDYSPDKGAYFEVHYEKSRIAHGEDIREFYARLNTIEGINHWEVQLLDDSNFEKTIALKKEGSSQKEIADELGLNKSTISRYIRKANNDGRFN